MKCARCGAEPIADGSLFCPECGSPLTAAPEGAPLATPPDHTVPMTEGQPIAPAPTQAFQPTTLPLQGGATMPPGTQPPVSGSSSGGPIKALIALAVIAAVLIAVIVVLLMNPFGSSGKGASPADSSSSSSANSETSVTLNSRESDLIDASESASEATAPAEAQPEVSTTEQTTNEQATTDAEANHGLQEQSTSEENTSYEREDLYYNAPFWGAWIGAFSDLDKARVCMTQASAQGLPCYLLETTDWENLNPTHYWVVSVGRSSDEATARALCDRAIAAGFSDAYVKYSGNHR